MDFSQERVVVTGGAGFLGRSVCAKLRERGVSDDRLIIPRRKDYDLTLEADVARLYADAKPTVVIHLAAEVGGIGANRDHPGRFFFANAAMGLHLIEHGRINNLKKFVQTGTVCAYPKFAEVPFREDTIWDGYPEETNAPYGVAKKALFVMLDGYRREYNLASSVVVPVNLFGPHDNFDLHTSHVIPALIRKCIEARENNADHIECWGTGSASREFLYVDDAAEGIIVATEKMDDPTPINLGTGSEITIKDLVELIVKLTNFQGEIRWDATKPDGQPRRCLDTSKAEKRLGWKAQVNLEQGLRETIEWFEQQDEVREVVYG
ncbi:GDP-L-fucose synthase family protein [Mucisphaera calidilacus]|uniref:GDP-L-fucose synthase n=1 Tax=Mucisphaera calidilacus TaxID=2527982 RepID=A0A518BV50_9BACT|nr:GDP-L-fucose synthase [Mucisphaera calidilacus]QDU70814.1 GDP-L-fucose synthase [Mucisphaera calidilacus]